MYLCGRLFIWFIEVKDMLEVTWWQSLVLKPLCLFLFVWPYHETWGILVSWPGIKPGSPEVEAQSPNSWTTREFPKTSLSDSKEISCYLPDHIYLPKPFADSLTDFFPCSGTMHTEQAIKWKKYLRLVLEVESLQLGFVVNCLQIIISFSKYLLSASYMSGAVLS